MEDDASSSISPCVREALLTLHPGPGLLSKTGLEGKKEMCRVIIHPQERQCLSPPRSPLKSSGRRMRTRRRGALSLYQSGSGLKTTTPARSLSALTFLSSIALCKYGKGASIYDVRKIFGFFYSPPPFVTVTYQLNLFPLSAFLGSSSPHPVDVIDGSPEARGSLVASGMSPLRL